MVFLWHFFCQITFHKVFVSSAIYGAVAGLVLAFVVILLATRSVLVTPSCSLTCYPLEWIWYLHTTRSPRMALFAGMTITCIIVCVIGCMELLGWELGPIESICITILAGFSVDYVVHLAHSYTVSEAETRYGEYFF